MTNLDSILKSRDITLPTNVHIVKTMVSPVVMYECESWTIKKAECWRTDVFQLWCRINLLRIPYTARRSNQSILKEINAKYSLEGLMLKLKLQCFGHLMRRANSLEKSLMLGKIEGSRYEGTQSSISQGEDLGQMLPHSPQKEPTLPASSFWNSSFQNCETINFCCLSHPIYSAHLWQP